MTLMARRKRPHGIYEGDVHRVRDLEGIYVDGSVRWYLAYVVRRKGKRDRQVQGTTRRGKLTHIAED